MENWRGRFSTTHYSSYVAKGEVSIDLDGSKKPEESYKTKLTMVYTGLFNNGGSVTYDVTVENDKITIDEANITLEATYKDKDIIRGKYSRSLPLDHGSFLLYRKGTHGYNEIGVQGSGFSCVIL